LTKRFLTEIKASLMPGGIVYLPTRYDTDRYITTEQKELLSIIYNVLRESFNHVTLWPGSMTLLFASDVPVLDIPYDSIISRLADLEYAPQFISENYLYDRLDEFRMERLREAVSYSEQVNSLDRPLIPHYQMMYRAKATAFDRDVISLILGKPVWILGVPLLVLLFFVVTSATRAKRKRFGLFLYFTAGLVSLALELISFYVYQSTAGSLYAEMAVLIGAFMLGLAFGTYYSMHMGRWHLEFPALLMLLVATLMFLVTYDHIKPQVFLFYHICFLFVVAVATGSLFVAATNRYYPTTSETNRGTGYACELIGSSFGALFSTTILLPVIGLWWLLASLIMLLAVAFGGAFLTRGSSSLQ
jgi:spermidine synthase